jgi:cytochrome c556
MKRMTSCVMAGVVLLASAGVALAGDSRRLVNMPEPMQEHMLGNMRDHVMALDAILAHLAAKEWSQAADVAEQRLGLSSLDSHGAGHMAGFMPKAMQDIGTGMHRAASRFALRAQEGELAPAIAALREVTASCVACHAGYRIR